MKALDTHTGGCYNLADVTLEGACEKEQSKQPQAK